jgi:hypothetical protein
MNAKFDSFTEQRIIDAIAVVAVVVFLIFFMNLAIDLLGLFQDKVYTNALAEIDTMAR